MLKKVMLSLVVCMLAVGSAQATVIFSDNFDGQPLGTLGTSVPVGMQWYNDGAAVTVVNTYAQSGAQSLQLARPSGGSPNLLGLSAGGTAVAGNVIKISYDQTGKGYDSLQSWLNFGGGAMGGFMIMWNGHYAVQNNGLNFDSGLTPSNLGTWDHVEMIVSLVNVGGNIGGTYDAFITQGTGTRTQIASAFALVPKATDGIARIHFQEGSGYTNYIDNVKMEIIPEPATLSILGLGLLGLLRRRK